jgi:hypothetical protein
MNAADEGPGFSPLTGIQWISTLVLADVIVRISVQADFEAFGGLILASRAENYLTSLVIEDPAGPANPGDAR